MVLCNYAHAPANSEYAPKNVYDNLTARFNVSFAIIILLAAAGFAAGFVDSIAGGGGLITVPALMAVGLPPQIVLGTNKLQSSCGTSMAVAHYYRAGLIKTRGVWMAVAGSFLAGMGGALAVSAISNDMLRRMIPWMLAGIVVYTALNRRFGLHPGRAKLSPILFALLFGIVLGFYDGFFGPGTGSFWTLALVAGLGLELKEATGYTKAVNLASNLGSLVIFLAGGAVNFAAAGAMICGQVIGAQLGARLAIRRGAAFIRPVFLIVASILAAKLLWDVWRS